MASPYWFVWKTVQCVISFRLQYFMCIISFIFIFRFECGFLHCIFVFSTVFLKVLPDIFFLGSIFHTHIVSMNRVFWIQHASTSRRVGLYVLFECFLILFFLWGIDVLQEVWMFSLFQAMQKSCCLQNAHLNASNKAKICLDAEVDS